MNTAQRVREHKALHPELYCPKCLWKIQTERGPNPCKRHPVKTEPTHIKEVLWNVMEDWADLESAETPEERKEDSENWNKSVEEPDDHYPTYQYTDEEITKFEQEESERAITERPFKKPSLTQRSTSDRVGNEALRRS